MLKTQTAPSTASRQDPAPTPSSVPWACGPGGDSLPAERGLDAPRGRPRPEARRSAFADPAADEAAIRQRLIDWTAAFNARDAAGACDLFAPDLAYAVPDVARGDYATMCGNFARLFAKPGVALRYDPPTIHDIIIEGDLAVVRLTWTLTT